MCGSPDAVSAEKVIAEKFAYIIRVVLEPLQVYFTDSVYGMLAVFVEFAEIDSEVAVVPVR